jgi:drug/metabolite transporter (DMT)-like permease
MMDGLRRRPRVVAVLLLLVVSTAWGATFVVVKHAIAETSVMDFLAWRFTLAGFLLVALRPRAVVRLGWRGCAQGALLGCVLASGYVAQTYGLRYTPAAVSGFLTGLQVVFTPLIGWVLLRHRPGARTWAAILVATTGLAVLSLRGVSFGVGETLTVASAALFALQIVGLGRWVSVKDAYGLAAVQLVTVGLVSLVAASPRGVGLPESAGMWGAVVLTAVAATAFAFVVQSWAQSHLSATAAAVVFTTEPVFAALFAWIAGERLGWAIVVGGVLVVAAMLVLGLGNGVASGREPRATTASARAVSEDHEAARAVV